MIHEIIALILLLGGGAFYWWTVSQPVTEVISRTTARYGVYFTQSDLDFVSAIINYMPLFLIIGGVIMVLVSVQRTRPVGYY